MVFFADLLLAAGAIGVASFCLVLSRRLKALGRLDSGIGGAIAVLTAQVDDLTRALRAAQATAKDSATQLENQTKRADAACRQLELLMASLHDLPPAEAEPPARRSRRAAETVAPASRPLAQWNTNRLRGAEAEPTTAAARRAEPADEDAPPVGRAKALAPVAHSAADLDEDPADRPARRARARVVRRRQIVGARA